MSVYQSRSSNKATMNTKYSQNNTLHLNYWNSSIIEYTFYKTTNQQRNKRQGCLVKYFWTFNKATTYTTEIKVYAKGTFHQPSQFLFRNNPSPLNFSVTLAYLATFSGCPVSWKGFPSSTDRLNHVGTVVGQRTRRDVAKAPATLGHRTQFWYDNYCHPDQEKSLGTPLDHNREVCITTTAEHYC